ncbi:fructosamine kinase family protein [Snuella lapsa]|uniref:Fructosamine kinase family protein n=1 Tax=Snuella lapsa TaxID=870481 RepID=A0ABP6Y6X0_9FLAO
MDSKFKEWLSHIINQQILSIKPISGGDISHTYKVETSANAHFLKVNMATNAAHMFQSEAYALNLISSTNTIKTPKVLACDTFNGTSFLLLEYIENKSASPKDFENLGLQLAALHKHTAANFGLEQDNAIGSLHQSNTRHQSWIHFYTCERLLPQLKLAKQHHLLSESECPSQETIQASLQLLFSEIKPVLLHGDLWSGNYIIATDGSPYLIDPAAYYGHNEVDIAMSKLFGGFAPTFYDTYFQVHKLDANTQSRIDIYQLYYLLVHLNLFGTSYYHSVIKILKKYF